MEKFKTLEVDRWSEPDEKGRVKHIGMADAKETFEKLKAHLEQRNLLPDEYFSLSGRFSGMTGELPNFGEAVCTANFGSNEGIYLDIVLVYEDEQGKQQFDQFATGKTLGETADDYFRMFRIAAECSLMLNGRGRTYPWQHSVELAMSPAEANTLKEAALRGMQNLPEEQQETVTAESRKIPSVGSEPVKSQGRRR